MVTKISSSRIRHTLQAYSIQTAVPTGTCLQIARWRRESKASVERSTLGVVINTDVSVIDSAPRDAKVESSYVLRSIRKEPSSIENMRRTDDADLSHRKYLFLLIQ